MRVGKYSMKTLRIIREAAIRNICILQNHLYQFLVYLFIGAEIVIFESEFILYIAM